MEMILEIYNSNSIDYDVERVKNFFQNEFYNPLWLIDHFIRCDFNFNVLVWYIKEYSYAVCSTRRISWIWNSCRVRVVYIIIEFFFFTVL